MVTSLCGNRTTKGKTTIEIRRGTSFIKPVSNAGNVSGGKLERRNSVRRSVESIGIDEMQIHLLKSNISQAIDWQIEGHHELPLPRVHAFVSRTCLLLRLSIVDLSNRSTKDAIP